MWDKIALILGWQLRQVEDDTYSCGCRQAWSKPLKGAQDIYVRVGCLGHTGMFLELVRWKLRDFFGHREYDQRRRDRHIEVETTYRGPDNLPITTRENFFYEEASAGPRKQDRKAKRKGWLKNVPPYKPR